MKMGGKRTAIRTSSDLKYKVSPTMECSAPY